jgi:small conductance mechanosensitive channel
MTFQELLQQTWARNVAIVTAELVLVLLFFLVLTFALSRCVRSLARAKSLERIRGAVEVVQHNLRVFLLLGAALVCAIVAGIDGWWWYQGADLYSTTRARVEAISPSFWTELGIGVTKVLVLAIAAVFALRVMRWFLAMLCVRAKTMDSIRANDAAVQSFFGALQRMLSRATWLGVLVLSSAWLHLPASAQSVCSALLSIYLTIALGLLVWRALDTLIASLDGLSKRYADRRHLLRYYDRLQNLMPLFRRSVEYVLYILVATLVVRQIEAVANLAEWGPRLISIVGIVFLSRVAVEMLHLLLEEFLILRAKLDYAQKRQRVTIVPLVRSILNYVIYFWAGILILKELSIDPTPILAGAGLLALAVGLGAQNLVNDVVSGFFSLFENQFYVGDVVAINGVEGTIEAIELRVTRLRDGGGRQHIIRNGQITTLVNYSKEYVMAEIEVSVAYEANIGQVFEVLEKVGESAHRELSDVLAPMEVQGLVAFGESDITVRTVTRVRPGCHAGVARDLRLRIKEAFDREGIEMPYARRVVIFQNPAPLAAERAPTSASS